MLAITDFCLEYLQVNGRGHEREMQLMAKSNDGILHTLRWFNEGTQHVRTLHVRNPISGPLTSYGIIVCA